MFAAERQDASKIIPISCAPMKSPLLNVMQDRVLVFDGAMGTSIYSYELPLSDFDGHENCTDVLVNTRPDVIAEIHRSFLAVGCDVVGTDTFGANKLVFAEFGISELTRSLNRSAAEIARRACEAFATPDKPRFVVGSMGPGTRLPSLRQTDWDTLVDSYTEQARGLLDGGVDASLIETCHITQRRRQNRYAGLIDRSTEKSVDSCKQNT